MKQITVFLTDDEWKELLDSVKHETGESLSDNEIEEVVKKEVLKFIRDNYIHGLGC